MNVRVGHWALSPHGSCPWHRVQEPGVPDPGASPPPTKVSPAPPLPSVLPRDSAVGQAQPEEPLPLPAPALFEVGLLCCSSFRARWVLA